MKAAAAVAPFFAPSAPVPASGLDFEPASANDAASADRYFETGSLITLKDLLFLRGRAGLRFHIDVVHAAGRASAMFTATAGGLFDFVGLEVAARGFFEEGGPAYVRFEGTFADGRVIAREAEVYRDADELVVFGGFSRLISLRVFAEATEGAPWRAEDVAIAEADMARKPWLAALAPAAPGIASFQAAYTLKKAADA